MGNAPEVVREVGVHHFPMAAKYQLLHLDHRLLGVSPATVGVKFRWKVGFKDRLQHQELCWILGDGVDQAADISWFATSIASRNFTPRTIFGTDFVLAGAASFSPPP